MLFLLLAGGCMPQPQLGARPAENIMDAAEAYLRKYQPGPEPRLFQTARVYDRNGVLLAERWEEGRRTWMPLNRISKHLIDATIATEDSTFYTNYGVDPMRVVGAALQNYEEGEVVAGAGTITMQLARNLFFGPDQRYDRTMDRKLIEAGLAQELTSLFSKDEILEMYLNLLNYGHLAYGPEAAAQVYFGKPAADLTLAEATLLAGIPQQPADLELFENFQLAKARQRVVLDLMVRHRYLTQAEADVAFVAPVRLKAEEDAEKVLAPHFVQYLDDYLHAELGTDVLSRGGLTITSTLDLEMQALAERIVAEKVAELRTRHDLTSGALVAMRPGSGEVLAMVGSADFANDEISGQVNVAVSPRQPGSAIKPILYATALSDTLISPNTVLWDVPAIYTVSYDYSGAGNHVLYTPRNYDGKFRGPVTVRMALANSLNVPAVKLLAGVTVDRMLESARTMGIRSLDAGRDYGLSLTLGGGGSHCWSSPEHSAR
jgi:membrane peptidoglycan carboxypeptidase